MAISKIIELKDFSIINWQYEVERIYELEKEQKNLLDNNDLLNTLKKGLEAVEQSLIDFKR